MEQPRQQDDLQRDLSLIELVLQHPLLTEQQAQRAELVRTSILGKMITHEVTSADTFRDAASTKIPEQPLVESPVPSYDPAKRQRSQLKGRLNWSRKYLDRINIDSKPPVIEVDIGERAVFVGRGVFYDFGESPRARPLAYATYRVIEAMVGQEGGFRLQMDKATTALELDKALTPHELRRLPHIVATIFPSRIGHNRYNGNNYLVVKAPFELKFSDSANDEALIEAIQAGLELKHTALDEPHRKIELPPEEEHRTNKEIELDMMKNLFQGKPPKVVSPREAILLMDLLADEVIVQIIKHAAKVDVDEFKTRLYANASLVLGYQTYLEARRSRQIRGGKTGAVGGGIRWVTGGEDPMISTSTMLPSQTGVRSSDDATLEGMT